MYWASYVDSHQDKILGKIQLFKCNVNNRSGSSQDVSVRDIVFNSFCGLKFRSVILVKLDCLSGLEDKQPFFVCESSAMLKETFVYIMSKTLNNINTNNGKLF